MNRRRDEYYRQAHDERVEPHGDLVPDGMPPADWGGVIVQPSQKKMPVGDPTVWGGSITTVIDTAAAPYVPRPFYGDQVILAQAADRYARSWSLVGNLAAPIAVWTDSGPSIPVSPEPLVDFQLMVFLSVTLGQEKVTIEHQILLMAGQSYGLCNQQWTANGGPYVPQYVPLSASFAPTEISVETRSFACIGALIGNTISVRGLFIRGGDAGSAGNVPQATLSCLVTPYAPGSGI